MITNYFTFMAALLVVLMAGGSIFLMQDTTARKKSVNWLYVLTGGLAFYCIESTAYGQPLQHTFLLVVALYIVPISIDCFLDRNHKTFSKK